jgi:hypothetical protein
VSYELDSEFIGLSLVERHRPCVVRLVYKSKDQSKVKEKYLTACKSVKDDS